MLTRTQSHVHRSSAVGARAVGASATGPSAVSAFAVGAAAAGAAAVGALAIGRLAIGRAVVRELEAGRVHLRSLTVDELHVAGQDWPPSA